jgi:hypothetical protein
MALDGHKPVRKSRYSIRGRYADLIDLVAFANGLDGAMAWLPRAISAGSPICEQLRADTNRILHAVARTAASSDDVLQVKVDVPAPPPANFFKIGDYARLYRSETRLHDTVLPILYESELSRLKICPVCDAVFVLLNRQSRTCSPSCSNTKRQRTFYQAHTDEERRRKLKKYRENRPRNREAVLYRRAKRRLP